MPEDKKELIVEVSTNAAKAAKDVRDLSGAVNDLGETQQQQGQREKTANTERARAASNLRQILEAMLGQLRSVNTALGDVSASSARTAETAERAFKKVTAYERALRKEKHIGDREETQRQITAKENFKAEKSRTQERLNGLKLLAAGGAVIGAGKMALNAAFESAGRGMALLNSQELTGIAPAYMRSAGWALRGRNGSDETAISSISALSQKLFNFREGIENPSAMAAKYLSNIPIYGSVEQVMEYLAERLPQLTPQQALAAGSGLGLSPEIIALLRNIGGAENWRKLLSEGEKQTAADEENAKNLNELKRDVQDGFRSLGKDAADALVRFTKNTTPEQRKSATRVGAYMGIEAAGLWGLSRLSWGKAALLSPWTWTLLAPALGASALETTINAFPDFKYKDTTKDRKEREETGRALKTLMPNYGGDSLEPSETDILPSLTFNMRQYEDAVRSTPFNYMSGRDYFDFINSGKGPENSDNRQYAVNVENINITTRDDPQSVANAAQDGLGVAVLRMIDRHTAGVYNV